MAAHLAPVRPPEKRRHYLNAAYGWQSWLFTLDHKRIAILYLLTITLMFFVGGLAALLFRLHLLTPEGTLVQPQTYNKLFSAHGLVMVFFFLIPSIPAVFGNFLVPLMIGARDLAFPAINLLSWYLYVLGAILILTATLYVGVDTGWTLYAPYTTDYAFGPVALALLAVLVVGFSSILTGLNFVVTIHKLRAPGLTWFRLPLFIWAHYATSLIQILATPVLAILLITLILDRTFGVGIYDPRLGGDPVLMQHLFWFYSHPAVDIMVLPAQGVISELIPAFARRPIFGYHFIAFSSLMIAVVGFVVWGHHMFTTTQSAYAGLLFSLLSFLVAIPSSIKVFNWTATLYKGSIRLTTPMLYALGFIGLFTIGGLTGLHLAAAGFDLHVHDTYFVVAHFHYIMVGGSVTAYLGALHFRWPKMTGRLYPEVWGKTAAVLLFIGFNLTFFPHYAMGYLGMPRRYATYWEEYQVWHVLSTAGSTILGAGYLLPFVYLLWSLKRRARAEANPWRATGLEWRTPSPPPTHNFDRTPIVTTGAYAYSPEADELEELNLRVERARTELARARAAIVIYHAAHPEELERPRPARAAGEHDLDLPPEEESRRDR